MEACVLGSINLSNMYEDNKIDWIKLENTINTAVEMLDNIIDKQQYPLPEIEKMHKSNRKIGLGVMGWADLLIKMKIVYGSEESFELVEEVMRFINDRSHVKSVELGINKGAYLNYKSDDRVLRNATRTTIAPTGTLSIIANCSSGIEPNFAFRTKHKRMDEEYETLHPLYEEFLDSQVSLNIPKYFITASEVSVENHIKTQAAFQKHTDNAVSKTINLPNSATKEDVEKAYLLAYELECKGITVYRDGSRQNQVLTDSSKKECKVEVKHDLPSVMNSKRVRIETNEGMIFINISMDDQNKPLEVFIHTPAETKYAEVYETIARIFSVSLRAGVPLKELLKQLDKANTKYGSVSSVPAAIMRAFSMIDENIFEKDYDLCPECENKLVLEEGCKKCFTCGYSKCS